MTTLETLRAARALIAKGWTQGACARDGFGNRVDLNHADAVSWCSVGAMARAKCYAEDALTALLDIDAEDALTALLDIIGTDSVSCWNDEPGRTQAEVLEAFDAAIANLEAG